MRLGLYGKIGSGKSTIANYLVEKYGYELIDLDKIARKISLDPKVVEQIEAIDLNLVTREDGSINRDQLRIFISKSTENAQKINNIFWPIIKAKTEELLENSNSKNIIVDGAILPQLNITTFDIMIEIKTSCILINMIRIKKRDQRSYIETYQILKRQKELSKNNNFNNDNNDFKVVNNRIGKAKTKIDEIIKNK